MNSGAVTAWLAFSGYTRHLRKFLDPLRQILQVVFALAVMLRDRDRAGDAALGVNGARHADDLRDTLERGVAPAFPGEDVAQPADTGSFRRRLRQREIDVQLWLPTVGRATRIEPHGRRPHLGLAPAKLAFRVAPVHVYHENGR